jgi:molecular chaperone GrpE (heat shock protein)
MSEKKVSGLAKWPFILGDALLVGTAVLISQQAKLPLNLQDAGIIALCVLAGAIIMIVPFILEHRATITLQTATSLDQALAKLGQIESVAGQISSATNRWVDVDTSAAKTAETAREIAEKMAAEAKAFSEFLGKANDAEKGNLRLELEKLRRGEGEWVQAAVRIMDHVYALHVAAIRSGQRNVIEQVGNFQNACIDTTRRLGLAPFIAKPGEAFDAGRHKSVEETEPPAKSVVEATLATGFTFQGRLLRPALVKIRAQESENLPAAAPATPPDQLSLPGNG